MGEDKLGYNGLIQYNCEECHFVFWSESNAATSCASCMSTKLKQSWQKVQVSLIPEEGK